VYTNTTVDTTVYTNTTVDTTVYTNTTVNTNTTTANINDAYKSTERSFRVELEYL